MNFKLKCCGKTNPIGIDKEHLRLSFEVEVNIEIFSYEIRVASSKEKFAELIADNRIWFGEDGNNVPAVKRFLTEVKAGATAMTIWKYTEVGHSQDASRSQTNKKAGKKESKGGKIRRFCIKLRFGMMIIHPNRNFFEILSIIN